MHRDSRRWTAPIDRFVRGGGLRASLGEGIGSRVQGAWYGLPFSVRQSLYPAAQRMDAWGQRVWEACRDFTGLAYSVVEGPLLGDPDTRGRVLLVGRTQEMFSLARRFFHSPLCDPPENTPVSLVALRDLLERGAVSCDLAVVSLPALWARRLPRRFHCLPGGVEVVLDVAEAMRCVEQARRNTLRNNLDRIERAGYQPEVTSDFVAIERFYFEHYLPYVRERFGSAADVRDFGLYRRHRRRMELVQVMRGPTPVALGVSILHDDRYRDLDSVIVNDDPDERRHGAGHALYLFRVQQARAHGYSLMDLGPERPFLGSSLLQYKRIWGARLAVATWSPRVLGLALNRITPAWIRFFRRQPMVGRRGRRLVGLTIADPVRQDGGIAAVAEQFADLGLARFERLD